MYFTLSLDDQRPHGPGLWKFNNSLLQDTNFTEYISDCMNTLIEGIEHFPSVKLWWDFFKNSLKAEIISFSRTKRKNLSHERVVLTNEIIKLKAPLVTGDFSVSSAIRDLENKLKELVLKELSGVVIRSKARWLEEGEKPSCYFFKLERERIQRNSIFSVLDSNSHMLKFSKRLYSFILIYFPQRLLIPFVNKRALLVLKITLIFHSSSFYRSKSYLMPSKP